MPDFLKPLDEFPLGVYYTTGCPYEERILRELDLTRNLTAGEDHHHVFDGGAAAIGASRPLDTGEHLLDGSFSDFCHDESPFNETNAYKKQVHYQKYTRHLASIIHHVATSVKGKTPFFV